MANLILFDTSFLYALFDQTDKYHRDATEFASIDRRLCIVPMVALTEVTQLLNARVGQPATLAFLRSLSSPLITLVPITPADIDRVQDILQTYPEARLDFVDCCIMAMTEGLNVTEICTFDRRDFSIFRPTHCDYLELLP